MFAASSVGSGAPNQQVLASFQIAFARGQFSQLVLPSPVNDVHSLGSTGLVQEFSSQKNSAAKFALVDPSPNGANQTWQVYSDIYAFYTANLNAAGYPAGDTAICPSNNFGTCDYQLFTNNYAVFGYTTPFGLTFPVADPFYTEWLNNGGIGGTLGIATGATTAVTSVAKTAGTQQTFLRGAIFSYSGSSSTPSTYSVSGSIYTSFSAAGGLTTLGFPSGEESVLSSGIHRQVFEGGRIDWTPGTSPVVLFPIAELDIANASVGVTLNVGASATLTVLVYDTQGHAVTGRTVAWSTSNGSVAALQANGESAVVQAVGTGTASIYVTGEGKTSTPITVRVSSSCCGIGAGAPTQAISQAFQAAATRNHLAVTLPSATPVTQTGSGYVQTVNVPVNGGSSTTYVIAESAKSAIAFVIGGNLYAAYLANGGFTGPLGYPASDASPGGTQLLENGAALAGSPVRVVPVPIAAKWLQAGAETGPMGVPSGDALGFTSLSGIAGNSQTYSGGVIYGILSGARAGRAFILNGLILARYLALSGPAGTLGFPTSDSFFAGTVQVQNFETGYIDLQSGATTAVEHFNPRIPAINTAPGTVGPGGRVHIGISGFAFGANLSVSISGQPGFSVTAPGGVFSWDIVIPGNAKSGTTTIQAKDADSGDAASGAYTIASLAQLQPSLSTVSGDRQTGVPGSVLPIPLVAVLRDVNGNAMPGVPVSYTASPGASAEVQAVTDANGQIAAAFRLPLTAGAAALAISAAGRVVSFTALAAANSIQNFPSFSQIDSKGGLTAALAAEIRYYQNQSAIGSPNGPATPASLAQFLSANGGYSASETGGVVANPWVATLFAGVSGGILIEAATLDRVRDLLSTGTPVLLELSVQQDGVPTGGAAVDAIGVNADGSIAISDPNPVFGRSTLTDYLTGFTAQGHSIQATLIAAIRIVQASAQNAFVIASPTSALASASSQKGPCGSVDLLNATDTGGVRFLSCDGTQSTYELGFGAQNGAVVFDLTGSTIVTQQIPVNSGVAFHISRAAGKLSISAQTVTITSIVNSASGGQGLSPGSLFTIFGGGFSAGNSTPVVTLADRTLAVLARYPFQINSQIPTDVVIGDAILQVTSALGASTAPISISESAPGIFLIGETQGAILNSDGTINSASNPAQRGDYVSIYCTGLGRTAAQDSVEFTTSPVTVVLNGTSVKPSFAGLTPGIAGLYQVNVQLPASLSPGSSTSVAMEEGGQRSNTVSIAVN
jgi:uncharacterized protein (TIGR03437 family)